MSKITEHDVDLTRQFIEQYYALKRKNGSLQQWIELKFSCSRARAFDLLKAAEQKVATFRATGNEKGDPC